MHIIGVSLAAHFFNHRAEQNEAIIAVLPTTTRLKPERPSAIEIEVVLYSTQLQTVFIKLRPPDIPRSASFGQQFTDRHFCREFPVWIVGQILSQWIVERQLSRLYQLHC